MLLPFNRSRDRIDSGTRRCAQHCDHLRLFRVGMRLSERFVLSKAKGVERTARRSFDICDVVVNCGISYISAFKLCMGRLGSRFAGGRCWVVLMGSSQF
jgi:hypothetical protein